MLTAQCSQKYHHAVDYRTDMQSSEQVKYNSKASLIGRDVDDIMCDMSSFLH